PLEVYDRPANLFVASFIGTPPMNFVPATLTDGGTTVAASGFSLPLPRPLASGNGKKVVLGIRPESLREASGVAGGEAPVAGIPGSIEFVERLGHEVIVHARVGDDLLVAKLESHRAPEMGDPITLGLPSD